MCFQIKELILIKEPASHGNGDEDEENGNTDVIVMVEETDCHGNKETVKFVASFFSYRNIVTLAERHAQSGDFLSGEYFHAANMVLIRRCTVTDIRRVVDHLVSEGEFELVFKRLAG